MKKLIAISLVALCTVGISYGVGCDPLIKFHTCLNGAVTKGPIVWTTTFTCNVWNECDQIVPGTGCDFVHWYDWYRKDKVTGAWSLLGGTGANPDVYGTVACNKWQTYNKSHIVSDIVDGLHKMVHTIDGDSATSWDTDVVSDEVLFQ